MRIVESDSDGNASPLVRRPIDHPLTHYSRQDGGGCERLPYNAARLINIGHDRWTFDQHINLSYINKLYTLSANGIIEVNMPNMHYNYTSGSTYNFDLTALRNLGHYETGPVGYYFDQFGTDTGPSYLNGGKQTEGAVGWLIGYTGRGWSINSYLTRDIFARNIGKQTKIWVTISFKI